jgi:hypothetical protein
MQRRERPRCPVHPEQDRNFQFIPQELRYRLVLCNAAGKDHGIDLADTVQHGCKTLNDRQMYGTGNVPRRSAVVLEFMPSLKF